MNLLGKATDSKFWETVRTDAFYAPYVEELKASWDELCEGKTIPPLYYHEYRLFDLTGDRATYESSYFRRRGVLNASAILSLIYPNEEKYFVKLQDAIFEICNEYTWCLPAHMGFDGGDSPDVVDLFAAETGFSLSEIYTLHEDRLDDFIKRLVRVSIERRIINPTLARADGWWWESMDNNWLAVCAGSVGCTTMLMCPEAFSKLKPRFDAAIARYIDSFLGEGICLEGCAYWDYGFGFFTIYADMLKTFTDGKENYFAREDVRAIAAFPQRMFLTKNTVVSFSDMLMTYQNSIGIIHYLKSIYPDTVKLPKSEYCTYGIRRWRTSYILRAAIWTRKEYALFDEIGDDTECFYAAKSQWYVNKRLHYAFAAKGGHNKESHNHNDIGSFIYAKDGKQVLVDLGCGVYDKKYFSDERYTVLETVSQGHSVPIIDGEGQRFGEKYRARDVRADESSFSLDISLAYGNEKINSVVRRFDLSECSVTLTDEFDFTADMPIIERFISLVEPESKNGVLEIDGTHLLFDPSICDVRIGKASSPKNECYTLDFLLKSGVRKFTIEIR